MELTRQVRDTKTTVQTNVQLCKCYSELAPIRSYISKQSVQAVLWLMLYTDIDVTLVQSWNWHKKKMDCDHLLGQMDFLQTQWLLYRVIPQNVVHLYKQWRALTKKIYHVH